MLEITNKKLVFEYDTDQFDFVSMFSKVLNLEEVSIDSLHENIDNSLLPKSEISVDDDQSQDIYSILYKIDEGYKLSGCHINNRGKFLSKFDDFVNFLAKTVFKEDIVYQNRPTLRVAFPGNKAVGDWHRDREYNHPLEEINIWVPITKANNTNTIWIESEFDKEDYSPVNIDFGELLIFDSGLKHGNVLNQESKTRVSFDFRVIPASLYKEADSSFSYSQGIEFKIGNYYSKTAVY